MKDAKKTKQVLFLETEKRHADLKIKLKQYNLLNTTSSLEQNNLCYTE